MEARPQDRPLRVTVDERDGDLVLRLEGELDIETTVFVLAAVDDEHLAGITGALVIDLAALTFVDSSGLAALLHLDQRARAAGTTLVLAHPRANLDRLLDITGVRHLLTVEGTAPTVP